MPLAAKAPTNPRRLGSRTTVEVARDFAALFGAAAAIGLAAGAGLMVAVFLLA